MTGSTERSVLVLTDRAVTVRRRLEPVAWLVLEELAMRAVVIDGLVSAEESVRSIAGELGRSKDSVARALRQLTTAGLVERFDERGEQSGRFTGVRYVVDLRAVGLRLPAEPAPATAVALPANAAAQRSVTRPSIEAPTPSAGDERAPHLHDVPPHLSTTSGRPGNGPHDAPPLGRLPAGPLMTKSTNLHHGATPPRSRPAPGGPDPVGTDLRGRSRPATAQPTTASPTPVPEP